MTKENKQVTKKPSTNDPLSDQSALGKFHIGFEYDRTWAEAKQTVQLRPIK